MTYPLFGAPLPGVVVEVHRDGGGVVVDGVLVAVSPPVTPRRVFVSVNFKKWAARASLQLSSEKGR